MRTRLLRAIVLASLIVAVSIGWRDTMTVTVTSAEVPVTGLTRPVTILHASDLHGVTFGDGQAHIARALDGRHYDAAVINGDHIPSPDAELDPVLDLLSVLREHADVVFVTRGNHDTDAVMDALVAHGAVAVEPGGEPVRFATDAGTLIALPAGGIVDVPADTAFVLALRHYPFSDDALRAQTVGRSATTLYLAGHTHGGQIRLPLLGAIWAPGEIDGDGVRPHRTAGQNFFPELRGRTIAGIRGSEGVYEHISRGLGTQAVRLRMLAPAEMTTITLTPAS